MEPKRTGLLGCRGLLLDVFRAHYGSVKGSFHGQESGFVDSESVRRLFWRMVIQSV